MIKTDVLILGGGLAGLSTAYHLNKGKLSSLVVEKQKTPGGTAGSVVKDGFTFDYTGHLLHLHDEYGKKLILDLLGDNVATHTRSSWIYSHDAYTRYPFQANTYGLPAKVIDECLLGFLKTVHRPQRKPLGLRPSFKEWALRQFGEGICRHFMFPYNEKLWRADLAELTTEWQGRFVPKPRASEVLYGALTDQETVFGYNASFRYPKKGGIQVLPSALAARLRRGQLALGHAVKSVDLDAKVAVVEGLGEVSFEALVNTLPLPRFLDLATPLPARVVEARRKLRWNTVWNLNVGVKRAGITDKHWVYFPEKKYPFYRVGTMSLFSDANAPKGTTSFYVEVARRAGERVDVPRLENQILSGLRRAGLLKSSDKLATKVWLPIECGYVVYDFDRTPSVETIFSYLKRRRVESIGRYGGWKYSFMEETILDGKAAAERLTRGEVASSPDRPGHRELQPLK